MELHASGNSSISLCKGSFSSGLSSLVISLSLSLLCFCFPCFPFSYCFSVLEFFPNWHISLLFFFKIFSGIFLTFNVLVYLSLFFRFSNVNFIFPVSLLSWFLLVSIVIITVNFSSSFFCTLVFILSHLHFVCIVWFRLLFMVLLVLYYLVVWPITSKASYP